MSDFAVSSEAEAFSLQEREALYKAIFARRDVRSQFLSKPVPEESLQRILDAAHHAPSVGFMQPWDFILVRSEAKRRAIKQGLMPPMPVRRNSSVAKDGFIING